jgi:chromosome segregation ATPase
MSLPPNTGPEHTDNLEVAIALLQQHAHQTSEMLRVLHDQSANNTRVLIAVEEAQRTNVATLKEVREIMSKLVDDHTQLKIEVVSQREALKTGGAIYVQGVQAELAELNAKVEKHDARIDSVETTLAHHEERINGLSAQVKIAVGIVATTISGIISKITGLL